MPLIIEIIHCKTVSVIFNPLQWLYHTDFLYLYFRKSIFRVMYLLSNAHLGHMVDHMMIAPNSN